jgi:hypothetical protein
VPFEFATICAGLREIFGNAGTFFAFRGAGASEFDRKFLWLQKSTFLVKCGLTRGRDQFGF